MTDDLRVFWQNNDTAAALFYDLLMRAEKEVFDDEFLAQLAAYREAAPPSVRISLLRSIYWLMGMRKMLLSVENAPIGSAP